MTIATSRIEATIGETPRGERGRRPEAGGSLRRNTTGDPARGSWGLRMPVTRYMNPPPYRTLRAGQVNRRLSMGGVGEWGHRWRDRRSHATPDPRLLRAEEVAR